MGEFTSTSRQALQQRRKTLRRQRQTKVFQGVWRFFALSGLAAGVVWGASLPVWLIRHPDQVAISGNQLLATATVRELLPVTYPQSLLELEPTAIATHLKAHAPIADAVVSRRLLPPGIEIRLQERQPVALSLPDEALIATDHPSTTDPRQLQVGLVDAQGFWIPKDSFTNLDAADALPDLKVRGLRDHNQSSWPQLYASLRQSPVTVFEIDWRNPNNLILHTDLGMIHFGSYGARFPQQLAALDQMRNLNEQFNTQQVAYINLTNPEKPTVQMMQASGQP